MKLLLLILSLAPNCIQASDFYSSRELFPKAKSLQAIKSDRPFQAIQFSSPRNLWLMGTQHLWLWNTLTQRLTKYPIDLHPTHKKNILVHKNKIFVSSGSNIWIIQQKPHKITKFTLENTEVIRELQSVKGLVYVITQTFVAHFNKAFSHLGHRLKITPSSNTKILLTPGAKYPWLWTLTSKQVQTQSLDPQTKTNKILVKAHHSLRAFVATGQEVYVQSKLSFLRVHPKKGILQTIPVVGHRKLIMMSITKEKHTFFFSDRIIEDKDMSSMQSKFYKIKTGRVKQASQLVVSKNFISFISDGMPRLFQLENQ